jgi:lipoic acid synthetase
LKVKKYYSPDEFKEMEIIARDIGFNRVAAGPFVRSSYQAQDLFNA